MFKFAVMVRKKITINTDPQRRCYDGCNFSEKIVWSTWKYIVSLSTRKEAEESAGTYQLINPDHQYKVIELVEVQDKPLP